ncbi:Exported protein [Nitrospira sp. KM1]|uniref:hypothetical protein n=1 Tax=Nitrospira sp. KM1 TaxID=1936990 RepID=UPI0013A77DE9|nr:hypothetical protein [Nitrospira sp. KM1]BCA55046.1 Exported protein [Nitrospira sp. KM1]
MRPQFQRLFAVTVFLSALSGPAYADTPAAPEADPMKMWSCPQADGTLLYTNKDRNGCTLMTLKPLSVVPSLDNMPTYRPQTAMVPHYDGSAPDRYAGGAGEQPSVPGWAGDWHASIASSGSVQAEVCAMYGEWLNLNQKSRGGFFFGTDPSYGGDLSGRNQRGASYSFYDNTRYHALGRIFGTGFVPVGCL